MIQIRKPHEKYGQQDATFVAAGGLDGVRRLVEHFYAAMDRLTAAKKIRQMHPEQLEVSIDKLTLFLTMWMGGPRLFIEKYGAINIPQIHSHLAVDDNEVSAWLLCMETALLELDYPVDFRDYLLQQLQVPAERIKQSCKENCQKSELQ